MSATEQGSGRQEAAAGTRAHRSERAARKVRQGYVVSDKMDKTIVVRVDRER
jgi:hypothetical protein